VWTLAPLAAAVAWPGAAAAHGLVGRAFLPVPAWLFAWAAGIVLVASFAALAAMWSSPRFESIRERRLCGIPAPFRAACGAIGVAFFAAVVAAGLLGSQSPTANLAPTAVFVLFWVGVPVLSVLFGDVFTLFNPWLATARAARWLAARTPFGGAVGVGQPYPERLGRWPAVATILGFAWVELVFVDREHPSTLAVLAVAYALLQLIGMAWVGIEAWSERGDGFGVAFNLFSHVSALDWRTDAIWLRRPLAGLAHVQPMPGTVALLCTMIGTTTFDGAANGPLWRSVAPSLARDLTHAGLGGTASFELTATLGLITCVLLCAGLYRLGIMGMSTVSSAHSTAELATRFVHTLAPIAFGYLLAHYFSLLVTQGQAVGHLISDPFGTGANIFGTAGSRIDYGLFSAAAIWYVQVAALIVGHVSGLALAHDRALVVYGDAEEAAASQRWMLVVMVTFTCLGLWLLSAVNT
jgi:hypothetical protein